jgi:hypothetical protein
MLKISHWLDNRLSDGGEIVSLTHQLHSTPQKYFLALISVTSCFSPTAIMLLEGLGKLKNVNNLIVNRTYDLPMMSLIFFNLPNHSCRTIALWFTQPVTERIPEDLSRGKERPALKPGNLATIYQVIV